MRKETFRFLAEIFREYMVERLTPQLNQEERNGSDASKTVRAEM